MKKLGLILPAYNPSTNWAIKVSEVFQKIQNAQKNKSWNLIIVNDGSTKGFDKKTKTQIDKLENIKLIEYEKNMGKGFAIRKAVEIFECDQYIYTDFDFPYSFQSILEVSSLLDEIGNDIVVGIKDENYYKSVPPIRSFISKSLRKLNEILMGIENADTQCGLKGFNNSARELFLSGEINGFLFDLEFLKKAEKKTKLKRSYIPISLRENIIFSQVRFKIIFAELKNYFRILGQ